ncbi:MAG: VOC family protein [Planctomycetes bacterium]|nr:VOC family protein [Planctomycetota bacterium]
MKTRIHIGLAVSNLEASRKFYAALFGASPTKVKDDYANWRLDEPALHLALVQSPEHARGANPVRHFGVELFADADLKGWRERVAQTGLSLRDEEEVICCYAKSDKFWAKDPDGNEWEFWVRLEEADAMKGESAATGEQCCAPAPAAKAESACCTPAQKTEAQAADQGCC